MRATIGSQGHGWRSKSALARVGSRPTEAKAKPHLWLSPLAARAGPLRSTAPPGPFRGRQGTPHSPHLHRTNACEHNGPENKQLSPSAHAGTPVSIVFSRGSRLVRAGGTFWNGAYSTTHGCCLLPSANVRFEKAVLKASTSACALKWT